jgi:dTDP-glucose 4,6-dehydratase
MATILITGGAGFIGGEFVRQCLAEEADVVVNLDKLTYAGNLDSLASVEQNAQHVFVRGDIGDEACVRQLLFDYRPRAIVNFAAESHVDRSIDDPSAFVTTNVLGTFRLLEVTRTYWQSLPKEMRSEFRFLHVSTDEVYGSLGPTGKFTESSQYAPNSPYSASKAASDHFVRAFHRTYGLPTLTTNCSNNYGPFQFPEKLVPLIILNCLDGRPLPIYGDGMQIRDWIYVADHCRAIRAVLDRGRVGEVYNIGGNSERTNLDVVRAICTTIDTLRPGLPHTPSAALITHVQDRPGHDRRYAIDYTKLRNQLHWEPTESFTTGIRKTVSWYLDHSDWVDRVVSGGYREERLGRGYDSNHLSLGG